jgi:hypothetical protein
MAGRTKTNRGAAPSGGGGFWAGFGAATCLFPAPVDYSKMLRPRDRRASLAEGVLRDQANLRGDFARAWGRLVDERQASAAP